jgi:hypothetical protein
VRYFALLSVSAFGLVAGCGSQKTLDDVESKSQTLTAAADAGTDSKLPVAPPDRVPAALKPSPPRTPVAGVVPADLEEARNRIRTCAFGTRA